MERAEPAGLSARAVPERSNSRSTNQLLSPGHSAGPAMLTPPSPAPSPRQRRLLGGGKTCNCPGCSLSPPRLFPTRPLPAMQIGTQGRHRLSGDPGGGQALLSAVLLRLKRHPSSGTTAGSAVDAPGGGGL